MVSNVSDRRDSQEKKNKIIIRSFIQEIFNEHYLSSIEKFFGNETVEGSPQAGKSGEGFKLTLTEFFKAFPHWRANIEHIVAENNLVIFLNGNGTHKGEFRGIPRTDKLVNIRFADLYKIENGIITGHWDVVDQLNLLKQTRTLLSEP